VLFLTHTRIHKHTRTLQNERRDPARAVVEQVDHGLYVGCLFPALFSPQLAYKFAFGDPSEESVVFCGEPRGDLGRGCAVEGLDVGFVDGQRCTLGCGRVRVYTNGQASRRTLPIHTHTHSNSTMWLLCPLTKPCLGYTSTASHAHTHTHTYTHSPVDSTMWSSSPLTMLCLGDIRCMESEVRWGAHPYSMEKGALASCV
jgi:hypothetical protein